MAHRRVPCAVADIAFYVCVPVQAAVTRSTKVTYARLDKLEAAVVRLSTLAGTQAHSVSRWGASTHSAP